MKLKKEIIGWLIVVAVCILIEVLFFNFRALESMFFEKADFMTQYRTENGSLYIEMDNINQHVDNIFLDIDLCDEDSEVDAGEPIFVTISKTDAADSLYYELPDTKIVSGNEQSKYLRLHLSGDSKKILVKLSANDAEKLKVNGVGINEKRPFDFSFIRLIVLFVVLGSIYLFRRKSFLFKEEFSKQSNNDL